MTLQPPDSFHLSAAVGWLELGDYDSANEELARITIEDHPDVLQLRWEIHRNAKNWEASLEVARRLLKIAPDRETSWVFMAQSYYYMQRYQEAFDTLAPALSKFPNSAMLQYDLACYHCLLGRLDEAQAHLSRAIELGGHLYRERAQEDPDLATLRAR